MNKARAGRVLMVPAALALLVVGATPSRAVPGDGPWGPARLSVRGAATSEGKGTDDGLGVFARAAAKGPDADGQFRSGHRGPDGERGVAGRVRCLARDAAGLIQVSGEIFGSDDAALAGKDFAATIDTDSSPQRFSELRVGDAGTLAPCGGGVPVFHPVTKGGYVAADHP